MREPKIEEGDVFRFLFARIDSVPHLEALLLIWRSRPRPWHAADISANLFIEAKEGEKLVHDLLRRGLIAVSASDPSCFRYPEGDAQQEAMMKAIEETYRKDLIKVSRFIHSKQRNSMSDFADAFRFRKDQN
ncbi:MAG TPA: hypothetical protein VG345_06115 [Bryobacteraceae bacterium]|jgi:hypothetical protein|nr:hypothetical protein [Bryobacteraceae bacterium]